MSTPRSVHAREFFRVALLRLEEAKVLMRPEFDMRGGAVYLAGYAVECMLKAVGPRINAAGPAGRR
jgi:hypothetical protein